VARERRIRVRHEQRQPRSGRDVRADVVEGERATCHRELRELAVARTRVAFEAEERADRVRTMSCIRPIVTKETRASRLVGYRCRRR
jgi:hypothetical protein